MAFRIGRLAQDHQPQDVAPVSLAWPWQFVWSAVDPTANLRNGQRVALTGVSDVGPVGRWINYQSATAIQSYNAALPTTQFTAVAVFHPHQASTASRSILRTTGDGFRIEPSTTTGGVTVNVTHTGVAAGAFIATNVSGFDSRPWFLVCTADGTTSKLWIKSPDGLVQFHSQAAGIAAGTGTIDLSTTGGSVGLSLAACSNRCVADAYAVELVNNPWLLFDDEVFYVPRAAPPTGVTISNVTATGITATTATPRYTIDLP
jgi:hypothetical protein